MRLNRRQLRRLIEGIITEDQSGKGDNKEVKKVDLNSLLTNLELSGGERINLSIDPRDSLVGMRITPVSGDFRQIKVSVEGGETKSGQEARGGYLDVDVPFSNGKKVPAAITNNGNDSVTIDVEFVQGN